MPCPTQPEVEDALERFLRKCGKPTDPATIYAGLADVFGLSLVERTQMLLDGPRWNGIVQYAKTRLVDRGMVARRLRQPWALTE